MPSKAGAVGGSAVPLVTYSFARLADCRICFDMYWWTHFLVIFSYRRSQTCVTITTVGSGACSSLQEKDPAPSSPPLICLPSTYFLVLTMSLYCEMY